MIMHLAQACNLWQKGNRCCGRSLKSLLFSDSCCLLMRQGGKQVSRDACSCKSFTLRVLYLYVK